MKTITILFAMLIACITTQSVNAQSDKTQRSMGIKTQRIKVSGTCNMDKLRIETAVAFVEGVKSAVWEPNSNTFRIKLAYLKNK